MDSKNRNSEQLTKLLNIIIMKRLEVLLKLYEEQIWTVTVNKKRMTFENVYGKNVVFCSF